MKELVEYIVRQLVDQTDEIRVEEHEDGDELVVEVKVAPQDAGRIIGRQGRIAKAIRTLVKAAAVRDGRRVSVDILD
ncbi:MAG: KH domain-containing protein [Chitinophagales bacterium]